jgi:hypothetical protein
LDLKHAAVSVAASATLVLPHPGPFGGTVDTQPVARPSERDLFAPWVGLPTISPRPPLEAQRLTKAVLTSTGWSHRALARVLNVTHPTVTALAHGRSAARTKDLYDRLVEVNDVVSRIHLVAQRDTVETNRLLSTTPESGSDAATLLSERRPVEAYLAALDVLRPPRQTGMMTSEWPAPAGEATSALNDD